MHAGLLLRQRRAGDVVDLAPVNRLVRVRVRVRVGVRVGVRG